MEKWEEKESQEEKSKRGGVRSKEELEKEVNQRRGV